MEDEEKRTAGDLGAISLERAIVVQKGVIFGDPNPTRAEDTPGERHRVVIAATERLGATVRAVLDEKFPWDAKKRIDHAITEIYEDKPNLFKRQKPDATKLATLYEQLIPNSEPIVQSDSELCEKAQAINGEYIEIPGYPAMRYLFELFKKGSINEAEFCILARVIYPDLPLFFTYVKGYTDCAVLNGFQNGAMRDSDQNGQEKLWLPGYDKPTQIILLKPCEWDAKKAGPRAIDASGHQMQGKPFIPRAQFLNPEILDDFNKILRTLGLSPDRYVMRLARISELQRIAQKTGFGTTELWTLCNETMYANGSSLKPERYGLCAGNAIHGGAADIHRIEMKDEHESVLAQLVIAPLE